VIPAWNNYFLARALTYLTFIILFTLFSSDSLVEIVGIVICLSIVGAWEWWHYRTTGKFVLDRPHLHRPGPSAVKWIAALAVCAAVAVPLSATGHHESNSSGALVIGVVLFTVMAACLLRLVVFIVLRLAGALRARSSGNKL
jgi:hypothetical protein